MQVLLAVASPTEDTSVPVEPGIVNAEELAGLIAEGHERG